MDFRKINSIVGSIQAGQPRIVESCESDEVSHIYLPRPVHGHPYTMRVRPGFYDVDQGVSLGEGGFLTPQKILRESDEILLFEDAQSRAVRREIKNESHGFWAKRDYYRENQLIHRGGILLPGPPGSGKSSLLKLEIEDQINEGRVVFMARSPYGLRNAIQKAREYDPVCDIVCVMEDLDVIVEDYGMHTILEMTDGIDAPNHIFFIATTNDIDKIPAKLIRRGRFGRRINVPAPSREARQQYLEHKFGSSVSAGEIKRVVDLSEGMGIGALRDVVVARGRGESLTEAVSDIRQEMLTEASNRKPRPSLRG